MPSDLGLKAQFEATARVKVDIEDRNAIPVERW
jgi:hypothetical protein